MFPPTSSYSTESVMVTELKAEHRHMAPMKGEKLKTLSVVITAERVIIRENQTLVQRVHLREDDLKNARNDFIRGPETNGSYDLLRRE